MSTNPLAQQGASDDLQAARAALSQADAAYQKRKPPQQVDQLAYLAQRHAQAGEARIKEVRARQEMSQAPKDAELANARHEISALQAQQTNRGLVMTLSDVLFDTGKATLKPGSDRDLDRLAQALRANPNTRVKIEGYTDSVGSDSYNQSLSESRAEAVADALRVRGVSDSQLKAQGFGKEYPVATNSTPAGRQQNRRVEIVFSDQSGRFAQDGSSLSR